MGLNIYSKVKELSLCDQRRILAFLTECIEEKMFTNFEYFLQWWYEEKWFKVKTQKKNLRLQRKMWKLDLERYKTMINLLKSSSSLSEYREKFYRAGLNFTNCIDTEEEVRFLGDILGFDSNGKPLDMNKIYYIKGNVLYKRIAWRYPLDISDEAKFKSKKKLKELTSRKNEILEILLKFRKGSVEAVTFEDESVEIKEIIEYIDELYKIHGEGNLLFETKLDK